MTVNTPVRGIRTSIQQGTVLARLGGGHGPAYPVDLQTLSQHISKSGQVATPGQIAAMALAKLSDVTITTPATNQVLTYNGTKWVNQALPTDTDTLATLGDVTLSGLANGQVLQYNGTKWVNASAGSSSTLASDTDVSITSPADKQALIYVSGTSKWTNIAITLGTYVSDVVITSPADGDLLRYDNASSKWKNHQTIYQQWCPAVSTISPYSGAFATVGNYFVLSKAVNIMSVIMGFQPATGYAYSAILVTINSSTKAITGTVAASTNSYSFTNGNVQQFEFTFNNVALSAGTWYAICLVLTNQTTTTSTAARYSGTASWAPAFPIDFGAMGNLGSSNQYWAAWAQNATNPTSVAVGTSNTNALFMMCVKWY
jgi:hypothetical protein